MRTPVLITALAVAGTLALPVFADSLDRSVVERPLAAKRQDLVACFDAALARNPHAKTGRIVTRYRIARDGKVEHARVTENDFDDAAFAGCVAAVFRSVRYEPMPKTIDIVYPLQFTVD